MRPYLCVYGHVSLDYILSVEQFPAPNTSVDILQKNRYFGGTGANLATVSASLGVPTTIVSYVGEDFPTDFREFMLERNVALDELITVEGYETPTVWIVSDATHDQIAYVYQGPMRHMDDFEIRTDMASLSDFIHIITGRPRYYLKLMERFRDTEKSISFDPSQEIHHIWSGDQFREALPLCDTFFVNESELNTAVRYMDVDRPADLLDYVEIIINTRGAEGITIISREGCIEVPAIESNVVDTTGAGDAFRAGFYAAKYRDFGLREAVITGASTASFIVESRGALTDIPSWEEVMERAKEYL